MMVFRSLRRLIGVAMATLLTLVFGMAVLGAYSLGQTSRQMSADLAALEEGGKVANDLVAAVLSEIRSAERYLIDPDPEVRRKFEAGGDSAYALQRRFRDLPNLDNPSRALINQIARSQAELEVSYATAHALADLGRPAEARRIAQQAGDRTDRLLETVRQLSEQQSRQSRLRAEKLRARAGFYQRLVYLCALLALVTGVAAAVAVVRQVDRQMGRLTGAADRFGAGDLRPLRLGAMPAELQRLAHALDEMASRLRTIVSSVIDEAAQLSDSAGEFSAMSQELAASSGEISSAMLRISGAAERQARGMIEADQLLDRLKETSASSTGAAQRAAQVAEEIRRAAGRYHADVETARTTLLDVREVVQTSSQQVSALVQHSESITAFIDLIKQISSQTHLLALNAAIEAARAGEHGRGFAVVAEEVRQLSDSSARAAEEVTAAVDFIRSQVRLIAQTMQVGTSKVAGIESVAQAVVRGLETIGTSIGEVQTAAGSVSTQTEQNWTVVGQIIERTGQVTRAASELASSSEEVSAAAEQQSASTEDMAASASALLEASRRLEKLMEGFRT